MSARRQPRVYKRQRRALLPLSVDQLDSAGAELLGLHADDLGAELRRLSREKKWEWLLRRLQVEQAIGPDCDPGANSLFGKLLADGLYRDFEQGLLTRQQLLRLHKLREGMTRPNLESLFADDEKAHAGVTEQERNLILKQARKLMNQGHKVHGASRTVVELVANGRLEGVRPLAVGVSTVRSWLRPAYRKKLLPTR